MRRRLIARRCLDQRGASAAEYALLVGLVAMVIIGTIGVLGLELAGLLDRSCTEVATATASSCS
jgi:Flp pilus assembly pilin Flp